MQVIMAATGEVKQVPDGYARNYLLPRKLATTATSEKLAQAKTKQAELVEQQAKQQAEYQALATQVEKLTLQYSAKASPAGRLFSAVHSTDLVSLLQQQGITVTADQIALPVIKQVGQYVGTFALPSQPVVQFTIVITAA